jgi:ribosome-associated toxin RatA of RatAB toxin-antitoxin module
MPAAVRTEIFEIGLDPFYDTIVNYKAYPEFVEQMTQVRVLKHGDEGARVRFTLHMIRDVQYTLDLVHEYPHRVHWQLVKSDLFRKMDGSWDLKPKGKRKLEVTYTADVEVNVLAPNFLMRQLVSHSLPRMMHTFYERARLNGAAG